jgi:hypothetical protein
MEAFGLLARRLMHLLPHDARGREAEARWSLSRPQWVIADEQLSIASFSLQARTAAVARSSARAITPIYW